MTKHKLRFLNYVFVISGTEMKMIRAGGVFNFREMIAHVNSNKTFQDFTMPASLSRPLADRRSLVLISPTADKVGCRIIKVAQ